MMIIKLVQVKTKIEELENAFVNELKDLKASEEAIEWVKKHNYTFEEAWEKCDRGDWMLQIAYKKLGFCKELVYAKAECANLFEHLMKDQRSLDALQACYDYCEGLISRDQLQKYAYAATAATAAAVVSAASVAASDVNSYNSTLKKCADICRTYLTDALFHNEKF